MLVEQLRLTNLLSFGSNPEPLELRNLNVVIGPNGSGKSNLLEAIDLLRNAPDKLANTIREGGGIRDWLWKGGKDVPVASLDAIVANPQGPTSLRYVLTFTEVAQRLQIVDEQIAGSEPDLGHTEPYKYFQRRGLTAELYQREGRKRLLQLDALDADRTILAQRRDPDNYPHLTYLAETLTRIQLYREWNFGRYTPARLPQKADLPNDALEPDGSNLGLVLNRLRRDPALKARVLVALQALYGGIEDYDVQIEGGTVQVFLHEDGVTIPATRLSDGTLRYLCLLAILCHPNPPPLVCIDEPELGLHPDILPTLAGLMREASERCQLIVTTHSDVLVDAMTDTPEAVLVCEKHDGATQFRRLSATELQPWLERYRLGELWTRGEIGGTRW
jgi:predicted ATPase